MAELQLAVMIAMTTSDWIVLVWCFAFGASIGSFLNVVIYRVPAGKSIVSPGSYCPSCRHPIRSRDNVPVLSWLLLRARCRDCQTNISARYPLVELITGLTFVGLCRLDLTHEVPNVSHQFDIVSAMSGADWLRFVIHACVACVLIVLALMDFDGHVLTVRGMGILAGVATVAAIVRDCVSTFDSRVADPPFGLSMGGWVTNAVVAAVLSAVACWATSLLQRARSNGSAAIAVGAMAGLCLNWLAILAAASVASIGSLVATRRLRQRGATNRVTWTMIFAAVVLAVLALVPGAIV